MRGIRKPLENEPRRALGQFFTPPAVADFAAETLRSMGAFQGAARCVDPAAGPAVFLDAVERACPRPIECVGLELDGALCGSKVHAGNGLLDHPHLAVYDGAFDLAVGNPPYGGLGLHGLLSLTRGDTSHEAWRLAEAVLCHSEIWRASNGGHAPPAELRQRRLTPRLIRLLDRLARFPIENLFMERFVRLLRGGGWLAVVVPDGLLANARSAFVRDWMARHGRVAAVMGLPRVFFRAGASARTAVLFFQRNPAPGKRVWLSDPGMEWRPRAVRSRIATDLTAYLRGASRAEADWDEMRGTRWDPQFWDPRYANPLQGLAVAARRPLGDFIAHMTYGPIVTRTDPSNFAGDIPVVSQGQIEESGVNLARCARVRRGCVFDPPRSRARRWDLLFPRSGAGSLGRNRLAVYDEDEEANVGCFVNVIRLNGMNPYFVWLFLKTRFGWGQLQRVINGVGMPNISFDEIRELIVPCVEPALQEAVERAYSYHVRDAHRALVSASRRQHDVSGARIEAETRFAALVASVERALEEGTGAAFWTSPAAHQGDL